MEVDKQGLLLWWQEECVFPVVKILPPGHTEGDTFFVCAVELIRSFMWMKVGCDIWLFILHILFAFIHLKIWRRKEEMNAWNWVTKITKA